MNFSPGGLNQIGALAPLTVSTVAVSPTWATGKRPRHALIHVATNAIRWRADGTAPTSTVGMYVAAGDYIDWTGPGDCFALVSQVQFIRDTGASGDAVLSIAYFD